VLALTAVGLVGLWQLPFPPPRFPDPAGPSGIGSRFYEWTDAPIWSLLLA